MMTIDATLFERRAVQLAAAGDHLTAGLLLQAGAFIRQIAAEQAAAKPPESTDSGSAEEAVEAPA